MGVFPCVMLCALAVLSLLLLRAEGVLNKPLPLFVAAAGILLAFGLRAACMNHVTADYTQFLTVWVQHFREHGGFAGIASYKGNYNIPYLYFLALFSGSSVSDLYLIKLLSILFDVVLAWGCLRLVGHFRQGEGVRLAAFLGALLLPTVLLNGAYWGQCDGIYVAFAIWALYFALRKKGVWSMIFMALSFAFKLQAVFFLPVYLLFLINGRVKFWHLLVFPAAYLVIVLPAVLLGKPLWETVTLYFNQTGSIGDGLNYNSPSMFALIRTPYSDLLSTLGILAAFAFIFCVYAAFLGKRGRATDEALLSAALALVIAIPFLLPHMHDRYFYGADVLSFAAALILPRLAPTPVLCSFASLLGYHAYLRGRYLLPMSWGAIALIVAILWTLVELAVQLQACPRRAKKSA